MVGAEGAVGGGQGGALALGADHSGGPLQAERLQLLAGAVGKAVGDLGLWPDLQGDIRRTAFNNTHSTFPEALGQIIETEHDVSPLIRRIPDDEEDGEDDGLN